MLEIVVDGEEVVTTESIEQSTLIGAEASKGWLRLILFTLSILSSLSGPVHAELSSSLYDALEAMRRGNPTEQQRALLFMNNDAINRARLNNWITDQHYQAAQGDFADWNQKFAADAARESGADFTVQKRTSERFSPGTDSDYITKVKSPDQIKRMQKSYNAKINNWLYDNGYAHIKHENWHNRLDTDFMADPEHVTKQQFEEIAKLNNDAYKRQAAAEYEWVSRAEDGTKVTPEQFRAYTDEMHDFINKKQEKMAQLRKNPSLLKDPDFKAKYHQMMAQEQKYLSRIESATVTLRKQEGLRKLIIETGELFEVVKDADGNWVMKNLGTIAERGAVRSPENYGKTLAASAVAQNSLERSIKNMSESLAEAATKNPKFRATAADDIARLMETLPPAQKGALIDSLKLKYGDVIAKDVAVAMRNQSTRFSFKKLKAGSLKALVGVGIAADLYFSAQSLKEYMENLENAMKSGITDAEAEAYFRKAQEAADSLMLAGGLGVLMEAYPPVAAAFGVWTISYEGGKAILRNTKTGQVINRVTLGLMDASMKQYEHLKCSAKDYLGYESVCEKLREVDRGILASVLKALREDRIRLAEGVTMKDIAELIRQGKYLEINSLITKVVVSEQQAGKACLNIGEYTELLKNLDQFVDAEGKKIADKIGKAGDAPDSYKPLRAAFGDIEKVAGMVNDSNTLRNTLTANLAVWAAYTHQIAQMGKNGSGTDGITVKEGPASGCENFDPDIFIPEINQTIENLKASLLSIMFVYESRTGKIDKTLLEEDELILKHLNNIRVAKGKTKILDPLIEDRQYRSDFTSREELAKLLVEKRRLNELEKKSEKALKEIREWRKNDQQEKDMLDEQGGTMQTIETQVENQAPISLMGIAGG